MSASSASTITCSALLFSLSPTANCNGAPLTRSSYTTLAGSNGEQEKPSAKGAWEANEREGPGTEAVASVAGLKTRRGNRTNIVTRNSLGLAKDRRIIRSALWNRKPSM